MSIEYKGYDIVSDGTYGYFHVKCQGKGSVHNQLRGQYTTSAQAKTGIDIFLGSQPAKVEKKGTAKDGKAD